MKKVLIVEDSVLAQIPQRSLVEGVGFSTNVAADGAEALKLVEDSDYVFIFVDIGLPDMNGFDLTEKLRNKGLTVPIVALTANNSEEQNERVSTCGLNDFLIKPLTFEKIQQIFSKFKLL